MNAEEIQGIFFVECEESLAAAEAGLAACRAGTQDADTLNAVFRGVHSIKGGAGAFGFAALQAYTHTFESLLSDVREGLVPLTAQLTDLLLRALDTLSDHVTAAREGGAAPEDAALLKELAGSRAGAAAPDTSEEPAPSETPAEAVAEAAPDDSAAADDLDLDSLLDEISAEAAPAASAKAAPEASAPGAPPAWMLHLRPHAGAMRNGAEPLLLLRELAALGARCLACDISALPDPDTLDPAQGYIGWTFEVPGDVSADTALELFDFVGEDWGIATGADAPLPPLQIEPPKAAGGGAPAAPSEPEADTPVAKTAPDTKSVPETAPPAAAAAAPAPSAIAATQSIRIDLCKLDKLIDTVGELVIAQAMLTQRMSGLGAADEELSLLEGLTREIQESAMAIRAQPIGTVFSRVPRILRELASSTGKHVRLEVSGEATELDKTVIERLGEPLTHLIRNAVDHGIENSADRLAAGKSVEGTLTLSAEQRSGRILIRIADDGKGIDRARVFAKAVEKGIVSPEAQLPPDEIDNLIFAPGFSTAETVTSVSGRGVGMDVVRQNVKDLGGRITIESEEGAGTTFTLALPLTLAISDGMLVDVGNDTLVVPLAHVVESLRPDEGEVQDMGASGRMLNVRGKFIPVIPVAGHLGIGGGASDPREGVLIVVDTQVAGQAALLVDTIREQRQFVIKSLEANFRPVRGVAGATILGDGRVALIVDVDTMVSGAMGDMRLREAA